MPQWRNKVEIKNMFTDEPNDDTVKEICEKLIPQLQRIHTRESNRINQKLDEYFLIEFSELIDEFIWIKDCIEKESNASEFSYDDWTEGFNNYFAQLFDMGDMITIERGFSNTEKFLWVG